MLFPIDKPQSAEDRFRKAFERLKSGDPQVLKPGALVSQNNVAKEAGCDPSAIKKARFPALIREIQAYVELHKEDQSLIGQKAKRRQSVNRSMKERLEDTVRQRDQAQSILTSANTRIIELNDEVKSLQRQLDELSTSPKRHNPI